MDNRLIELALEALESRRAEIESEISKLRAELRGARATGGVRSGGKWGEKAGRRRAGAKRRKRSAASRRAQSLKMKAYWARRKAEAAASGSGKTSRSRK